MMTPLYTGDQIALRVAELGKEISAWYREKPCVTAVAMLNGGMIFAADLVRRLDFEIQLDTFAASSYENDASSGVLKIRSGLKLPVSGRHVLLIDDILDTGLTLKCTRDFFLRQNAASVRVCVLLNKLLGPEKTKYDTAEWVGFDVPDLYVVGFGLDSRERYRNLPGVMQMHPDMNTK